MRTKGYKVRSRITRGSRSVYNRRKFAFGSGIQRSKRAPMIHQIVLLVEDETIVRNFVTAVLERENFVVLSAANAAEALEISKNKLKIDLLLTDGHIGDGRNGIELAEVIQRERPEVQVLVMSGFPDIENKARQRNLPFLGKPFTHVTLRARVRELMKLSEQSRGTVK